MAKEPVELENRRLADSIALLFSNAFVVTKKWYKKDEKRTGEYGLNEGLLPLGNWVILAQASFMASASTDSALEMRVALSVRNGSDYTPIGSSYLRLKGLSFGTATVIGAVTVSGGPASLEFSYMVQYFRCNRTRLC